MEGLNKLLESGENREMRKKDNVGIVKKYLEEREIKFLCDETDGFITIGFNDVGIIFRVSDDLVDAQMCFFKEIPDEAYRDVLVYLNKVNSILKEGHFEVGQGRGLNYRINTRVETGMMLLSSRVEEMLVMCSNIGGRFAPGFCKIIDDKIDGEEAYGQMIAGIIETVMKSEEEA